MMNLDADVDDFASEQWRNNMQVCSMHKILVYD